MFQFEKSKNRRHELSNANLEGGGQLVQALRWFVHRAGLIVCANSHHKILETEKQRRPQRLTLSFNTIFVLDQCYWQTILVNLRALLESDPVSLGVGAIKANLIPGEARNELCSYLDGQAHSRKMDDMDAREKYLDYILKYATILADRQFPVSDDAHPLVEKAELVRRTASKRITHSTLDDYKLYGTDLQDLIWAVLAIASAIEQVMGDSAIETDLLELERSALRGGADLLGVDTDEEPHTLIAIRGFLPAWVAFDKEFPDLASLR